LTRDQRVSMDVADIVGVSMCCHHCKTLVEVPLKELSRPPQECPVCKQSWFDSQGNEDYQSIKFLGRTVEQMQKSKPLGVLNLKLQLTPSIFEK
jgi:hypothetical protein